MLLMLSFHSHSIVKASMKCGQMNDAYQHVICLWSLQVAQRIQTHSRNRKLSRERTREQNNPKRYFYDNIIFLLIHTRLYRYKPTSIYRARIRSRARARSRLGIAIVSDLALRNWFFMI